MTLNGLFRLALVLALVVGGCAAADKSLRDAARNADMDTLQQLLSNGADIDAKDSDGGTALHWAVDQEHVGVVELLIANGADVNAKDNGRYTPLHEAAVRGRDFARMLICAGADVGAVNEDGRTPLHEAAGVGGAEIVRLLIDYGAQVNARDNHGKTALHDAAKNNHTDAVKLLIAGGADIEAKDKFGETPFHIALRLDHLSMARLLIAKGADIHAKAFNGQTALHLAARYCRKNAATLLIAEGVDVNATDNNGRTALSYAAQLGRQDIVDLLCGHTAPDDADSISQTLPDRPYIVLERGDVRAVIINNEPVDDAVLPGHRAGYSGVASLTHRARDKNLFVPFYAGLNFEHIHDGTVQSRDVLFEPRRAPMQIKQVDEHTAELHQLPTPHWQLESWLRYELIEDSAIEMTLECVPHARTFSNGYIGLFFASYIHQPQSLDIHFLGHRADRKHSKARWVRGVTPAHGKLSTHLAGSDARRFAHDPNFPLTLVFNRSQYVYSEPWYYGLSHGMALVLMFRPCDNVRFSQSPSGGGSSNPAWDFQWFVPQYEVGKRYRFVMRAMYLPFQSTAQLVDATAPHRTALGQK